MEKKELDKAKQVELEIMAYFVSICQKYHLTYYIFWGTLLGAIRHKGFIPWDDDIDVVMPPKDYLKFLKVMKKEENDKYYLQNVYTTKYCIFTFSKIRKYHTTMVEKDLNYLKFKKGIDIDIFPLIRYPKTRLGRIIFHFRFRLSQLFVNREIKKNDLKGKIIYGVLHLFPRSFLNRIVIYNMDKILKSQKDFDEYFINQYFRFNKEWFDPITIPFEKEKFIAPAGYDKILTKLYGDYMTPPPPEKRYGHGEGKMIISFDKEYDEL